ncbi:hypothetical protein OT109_01070 [Phycisphaeraceae bacterium D3-23]
MARMTAIVAVLIGLMLIALLLEFLRYGPFSWIYDLLPSAMLVLLVAAGAVFVFSPPTNRSTRRYRQGLCIECGYDLTGSDPSRDGVTCPECGCFQVWRGRSEDA